MEGWQVLALLDFVKEIETETRRVEKGKSTWRSQKMSETSEAQAMLEVAWRLDDLIRELNPVPQGRAERVGGYEETQ